MLVSIKTHSQFCWDLLGKHWEQPTRVLLGGVSCSQLFAQKINLVWEKSETVLGFISTSPEVLSKIDRLLIFLYLIIIRLINNYNEILIYNYNCNLWLLQFWAEIVLNKISIWSVGLCTDMRRAKTKKHIPKFVWPVYGEREDKRFGEGSTNIPTHGDNRITRTVAVATSITI